MTVAETILVVEDEAIVAMDLCQQLEDLGYRVVGTAATGEEAVQLAREFKPSLVLMDVVLRGDVDGIEAAKFINHTQHAPVVYLTAFSDDTTVRRAAETAPYGYLTKPYSIKELHAAIEVALYKSRLEQRLYESEQWFSSTLRCVADGVIAMDTEDNITFLNPVAEALTGWTLEDARGRKESEILKLFSFGGHRLEAGPAQRALQLNKVVGMERGAQLLHRDGRKIYVDDSAAPIRSEDGRLLGAVMVFRDVSERIQQEQLLRESEERFYSAFAHAPSGMALVALDGRFLQANKALATLVGYDPGELLEITHTSLVHPDDREQEQTRLNLLLQGQAPSMQYELRYQYKDTRHTIWILASVSVLKENDEPTCYLYQIYDLTERKQTEYQLTQMAFYDALTGLANRSHMRDELERGIVLARRHNQKFAVVFMDLDRFKNINDSLGHEAGDELLKIVSQRLEQTLRESDCIARIGGDEFVLLLQNVQTAAGVVSVLEKLRNEIIRPMMLAGNEVFISPSMGISMFPDDGEDAATLLRNADSAMFAAKAEGRNRFHFFRPELAEQADDRLGMESALRRAQARAEFELHYQPIVRIDDGTIEGFETLLRWRRDGRLVAAGEFIPVAEEIGLIQGLGEWVLREACRFAATWPQPFTIHINCSAHQLKEETFTDTVAGALKDTGIDPGRVCLEITESVLMQHSETQLSRLARLKTLGIVMSIDDYGTGYSSLAYLKLFAPQSLKIDRFFVKDLGEDPNDAAIVSATIAMAHNLGIGVIAEGVEEDIQLSYLRNYGCDAVQGYMYSRPVPAEEAMEFIRAGKITIQ